MKYFPKLPKWSRIICSIFLINMFSSGSMKVCGIFFEKMKSIEGVDGSLTGLIFVAPSAVSHTIAPIVSVTLTRLSKRQVGTVGGILVGMSFICSGLFSTHWSHFLGFAIFAGVGFGCLYLPSVLSLREEAPDHFASLMPLATMGTFAGIVVLPGIVEVFLTNFGFHAAVCLFGALAWNTVPCGLLLDRPAHEQSIILKKEGMKTPKVGKHIGGRGQSQTHRTVHFTKSSHDHENLEVIDKQNDSSPTMQHCRDERNESPSMQTSQVQNEISQNIANIFQSCTKFLKNFLSKFTSLFLEQCKPFNKMEFILFFVTANLRKFSSSSWTLFLIPFLQEMGMDKNRAVFMAAVGGIGGGIGRLVAAVSFRLQCASPINIFAMYYMLNALIFFVNGFSGNFFYLTVCAFVSGLLISAKAGMTSGILLEITGPDEFRQAFSLIQLGCGMNALLAGFLSGKIYDLTGSFITMFQMCAGISAISCILLVVAIAIMKSSKNK